MSEHQLSMSDMSSFQSNTALRKGTNSCTECRRRKVRCVRLSGDSASCRQCEERGSACIAQTSAHRPSRTPRLPSRYRISQLESQVSQLTRIVHNLESRIGAKPTRINSPGNDKSDDVPDDSEAESSASEILVADQPSHLRSLFQNEWLSVDTHRDEEHLQERRKKNSDLMEIARPRLQSLIPTKEVISEITSFAYDWLTVFQAILPQPFTVESRQEVLDRYEEMCRPDVDVIDLALWLLTIAISAQQIPQGPMSSEARFQMYRSHIELCRQIINTVEDTLLCHDRLLGTVKGLGMLVHILRLRIGQGSFQKGWIRLRHAIALAELMGLPKMYKAVKLNRLVEGDDSMSHRAAQLWELICNVDRLFGMILNLPPATRGYQLTVTDPLVTNGTVNARVYLCKLLDIAARVYDLDDSLAHGSGGNLHLELAGELSALASQTPRSWWVRGPGVNAQPQDFLQFMHYSIAMRTHLPLALRQDSGAGHMYNRLACTDACDSIVKKYEYLTQTLPPGFFVSKMLDLHAFIAAVVLLLTSHNPPSDRHSFRIDGNRLQGVAMKVAGLMGERAQRKPGSDLAREGHNTLCALNRLLQQDGGTVRDQDLTLKVPLLGKVHIRRNARQSSPSDQLPSQATIPPEIGADNTRSTEQMLTPSSYQAPPDNNTDMSMLSTEISPDQSQWSGLSWSIEESHENFFDNLAMGQDPGESPLWWDIADPNLFPP